MIFNEENKERFESFILGWTALFDKESFYVLFPVSLNLYNHIIHGITLPELDLKGYPNGLKTYLKNIKRITSKEMSFSSTNIYDLYNVKYRVKRIAKIEQIDAGFPVGEYDFFRNTIMGLLYDAFEHNITPKNKIDISRYLMSNYAFYLHLKHTSSQVRYGKRSNFHFGTLSKVINRMMAYSLSEQNYEVNIYQHGEPYSSNYFKALLDYLPRGIINCYNEANAENYRDLLGEYGLCNVNVKCHNIPLRDPERNVVNLRGFNGVVVLGRFPYGKLESPTSVYDSNALFLREKGLLDSLVKKHNNVIYRPHPSTSRGYVDNLIAKCNGDLTESKGQLDSLFNSNFLFGGISYDSTAYLELAKNNEAYVRSFD